MHAAYSHTARPAISVVSLAPILPALVLLAASAAASARTYTEAFDQSLPFPPNGTLMLRNTNGSIDIRGVEGDTLRIRAIKRLNAGIGQSLFGSGLTDDSARDLVIAVRIGVEAKADQVNIHTLLPKHVMGMDIVVDYTIEVPESAGVTVSNTNGAVTVTKLGGRVEASVENGQVKVQEVRGGVALKTVNGAITCRDYAGALEASTSNGKIGVTRTSPPGSLESIACTTGNGAIRVDLPKDAPFALTAHTVNGEIRIDGFDGEAAPRFRNHAEVHTGREGPNITLAATNGAIRVSRQ